MTRIAGGVLAGFLLLLQAVSAMAESPLAEPGDDLSAALVVDIRPPGAFQAGHIPGAVNAPYGRFRGPKENPGRVPSEAALQSLFRVIGAEKGRKIVIVHEGRGPTDFGAAARVYWTFKSTGFADLAILNGGYRAWAARGEAAATGPAMPAPSNVEIAFSRAWWIDADGVRDVVRGASPAVLIDARPNAFFRGKKKHAAATRAGTLAGALNIVHSTWFPGRGPRLDAPEELIAKVRAVAAGNAGKPLVSFCNTGVWAATNWFAASELAGIEGVKLYPESMVGWTRLGGEAVAGTN